MTSIKAKIGPQTMAGLKPGQIIWDTTRAREARRKILNRLISVVLLVLCAMRGDALAQTVNFFGDSNTACIVSPGTATPLVGCWPALATYSVKQPGVNHAASGATAILQASAIYAITPNATNRYHYMIGTNDERLNGTDANKRANFAKVIACQLGWFALDTKLAKSDSAWTFTGTWTNTVAYGLGKRSTVIGNTASFQFSGTDVRLCGIMQDGTTGTATVSVDGVPVGTWAFYPATAVGSPGYAPTSFDITGLSSGSHTVTVTHASGNYVYVDWAASSAASRNVTAANVMRMTAAGYAAHGGSDANVLAYGGLIEAAISALVPFGASVRLADIHTAITPASHLVADGIHLNQLGHWAIADAFQDAMN